MANEFDKFDGQTNAFDAFDARAPVQAPPISDEELNQYRALGFNGSKEDLARDKAQHEASFGQHSSTLQLARDIPAGAASGLAGLADISTFAPPLVVPKLGKYIYDKLRAPTARELVTGKPTPTLFPFSQLANKFDESMATRANTPQTGGQRIVRDITRAMSGTAATAGLGAAIGGPASLLAANPGTQLLSAATGAGASGATREAGGGKGLQLAAGLIGGQVPGAVSYGINRLIGEPNQAAKVLQGAGVDNLTPGQQQAGGAYSQIEDASTHLPLIGSQFQKAKDAAQQNAKEAFLLQASAPGTQVKPTGDLQETLTKVGDTFQNAYDTVQGFPLLLDKGKPVIVNVGQNTPLSAAIGHVVTDKGIDATNETRKQAASWLGNLLTRPIKSSEDLLGIRSEIRSRIRAMASDQSSEVMARREIYQGAENQITKALESQLPPNLIQNLAAVDAQYAKYKTAVDAMAKGGDRPGGFTWNEASQAAKTSAQSALGKDAYAKGQGFMRDIPAAARTAFATRPPTGASLTAQAASYPMLPITSFLSLTNTGRKLAANNVLLPYNPSLASINPVLQQGLLANQGQ